MQTMKSPTLGPKLRQTKAHALGTAIMTLTNAYDSEPSGATYSQDDDRTGFAPSFSSMTWSHNGDGTGTGFYEFATTSSASLGYVYRTVTDSSGEGGSGDRSLYMTIGSYSSNVLTN